MREPMRYKTIAATIGATSLLAMGITATEVSAMNNDNVDDAGATITQGPDPTTMANESFAPTVRATPPCGFAVSC
jgi:hypothetical protein